MLESLVFLTTSLAREFDIDPLAKTPLFHVSDEPPYLFATSHNSIVGHSHGAATACPGEHVIDLIPEITAQVDALLTYFDQQ